MFKFRYVVLAFGLANLLCGEYFGEISKGNLLMFIVTILLAFPLGFLLEKIMNINTDDEEDIEDFFDLLPEDSGIILKTIVVDSMILFMVTISIIFLYTGGNRPVSIDTLTLAIIGSISIISAFLYQYIFYKLGKEASRI